MDSFSNAYQTTLNGSIDNSQTTLVVTSTTGKPPSVPFRLRIKAEGANTNEIVTVIGVSGTTYTIIRASEAYNGVQTASAHANGATVEHVLTAGVMTNLSGLAGIKQSTLGTTSIGGSWDGARKNIFKKIILPTAGWISDIRVYVKGDGSTDAAVYAGIHIDNAGAVGRVAAPSNGSVRDPVTGNRLNNVLLDTTGRWISLSVSAYLEAETYWLAIALVGTTGDNFIYIAYSSGTGSDSTQATNRFMDPSVTSVSTGTNDYSFYANFIEATATQTLPRVKAYHSTTQTVSAATEFSVLFDSESFETIVGMHSTSSDTEKFYAPVTGTYEMDAHVYFSGSPAGSYTYIRINGSTQIPGSEDDNGVSASMSLNSHAVYPLNAGDFVELRGYRTSGTSIGNAGGAAVNSFEMRLVPDWHPTPVGAGSRVLLDYTKTSDDTGTSLPAATWTDIVPNQTFNVVSALSTVEFNVRSFIQVRDTGGGETYDQGRLVIDSGGTPIYEYFGGELINDNQYWDIKFKGNVYKQGLSAGSHTVKAQLLANGGGDFYNRATTSAPYEFFRMQVIEHSNAGDLNTSISPFVRGAVSSSGTIVRGSGFSVAKPGTGHYVITFSPAFVLIPVVVVITSPDIPGISNGQYAQIEQDSLTVSNLDIWTIQGTTGNALDCAFNFIAMTVA